MCCGGSSSDKEEHSDGGGCCGKSGGQTEKLEMWKQKKKDLVDYKFKDVDVSKFRDTRLSNIRKYIQMLTASSNYFLFIALDVQISYWLLKADPALYPHASASGAAYAAVSGLNIAWLCYNIYKAYTIVKSDDISDAYIHAETYRFKTITSFDVFCFFTKITSSRSCRDKAVLYVYDTLYQLPQIIFVKAPQIAIVLANTDALNVFANADNGIPKSQTSAAMKFGLLVLELGCRCFAVFIMWPWLRCCMGRRSLPEYANYLIESSVNSLVKTGKADVNQPEDEEKGGCCG